GPMRGLPVTLSWGRAQAVALALAVLGAGAAPACARAAELSATPSTFAGVFSGAQAGATIRLASGNYGTFRGALKSGMVTIAPHSGATAMMALRLNPAANITLDGLKITDALIAGTATKNLVVRNSDFDGARVTFRGDHLVNANVLFDNNVHSNVDVCSGCSDARVHIVERNDAGPNGITIRNSRFYGGSADGILNGGNGTRIIANTFRDLFQTGAGGAHTDSLQLYGSKNTLVKANFFYNVDMGNPSAYDRADHEIIEDNVVVAAQYPYAMQLLSDSGSVVRHNTFASTSASGDPCDYNLSCGIVRMGNKAGDPRSAGTVFENNILAGISIMGSRPGYAVEDYNLFADHDGSGVHDELGEPVFVGGERPPTYEGFRLAAGSPGKGTASDGLDRGARIGGAPPSGRSPSAAVRVRSNLRRAVRTGRLGLEVRTTIAGPLGIAASIRPGRALERGRRHSRAVVTLGRASFGVVAAGRHRVSLRLSRAARRRLRRSRNAQITARVSVGSTRSTARLKIAR
ncbi:MAG TPA: right-handed parallel beta-helix repeat-containing protein, partial [Solirubrobacteraceae bacterium]|nr:right-handed parallel beta-helix repeat-containing protein [Solirubrobacteraceae bacterium]